MIKIVLLNKLKFINIQGILGPFSDFTCVHFFKDMLVSIGSSSIASFKKCEGVEHAQNVVEKCENFLIVNVNLRVQEPLLNYKLRKKYLSGANFYYVGSFASLAFYMKHVSNQKLFLVRYLEGKTWLNSVNMGVISDVLSSKFFLRHNYLLSQNIYVMLLTLYPSQNS